jgi:hypothetical protein
VDYCDKVTRGRAATQGAHVTLNIDRHTFNLTAGDDTAKALVRFAVKAQLTSFYSCLHLLVFHRYEIFAERAQRRQRTLRCRWVRCGRWAQRRRCHDSKAGPKCLYPRGRGQWKSRVRRAALSFGNVEEWMCYLAKASIVSGLRSALVIFGFSGLQMM